MHHDLSLRLRFHYSYEIFEIADISQFCPFHHNDPHPQTWLGAKLAAATCTREGGGCVNWEVRRGVSGFDVLVAICSVCIHSYK